MFIKFIDSNKQEDIIEIDALSVSRIDGQIHLRLSRNNAELPIGRIVTNVAYLMNNEFKTLESYHGTNYVLS